MKNLCSFWSPLQRDFERRGSGEIQSPIDLRNPEVLEENALEFAYEAVPLEMTRADGRLSIAIHGSSEIRLNGRRFSLVEIHFHSPGEHAIEGTIAPMEMHMVHTCAETKEFAVVGVNLEMDPSQTHPAIATIFKHLPEGPKSQFKSDPTKPVMLDVPSLVTPGNSYYNYVGSLTTPPYTEGVWWFMTAGPIPMEASILKQFQSIAGCPNARELQSVNQRLVRKYS